MIKKLGIWGFGVGGKALVRHCLTYGISVGVMDKRTLNDDEKKYFSSNAIPFFHEDQRDAFFEKFSTIVPSAGIDLKAYTNAPCTFLSELDFFSMYNTRPIIAITGSLGKTTVTHILSHLLKLSGKAVITGGNIGVGMLDLLHLPGDLIVLELSSFQLEHTHHFAPDLAILTNFYPNHLDRHGTIDAYRDAKLKLFMSQKEHQKALIPLCMHHHLKDHPQCATFARDDSSATYYLQNGSIVKNDNGQATTILAANNIPTISYQENWLVLAAALDLLGVPFPPEVHHLDLPEHRCALVAHHKGIDFYDDSKATVPESTLAAVQKLHRKPIIILIGGLSKGVNREPLLQQLMPLAKKIILFGAEAHDLLRLAQRHLQYAQQAEAYPTLEDAFTRAVEIGVPNDQILLSPAGSSYDLYKNFTERGNAFQKLVTRHTQIS